MKVELIDNYPLDKEKNYQFYLNVDGLNFAVIGKLLKKDKNTYSFLIKESKIEQRRYPRIPTQDLKIKVYSSLGEGILADISLGGCKVKFEKPKSQPVKNQEILMTFYLPTGVTYKILAKVVDYNPSMGTVSFSFPKKDWKIFKLFSEIGLLIRGEK